MLRVVIKSLVECFKTGFAFESACKSIRESTCFHEFNLKDLKSTGIPKPEPPKDFSDYEAWRSHYELLYSDGPWFSKRVEWRCVKCEKILYANCGLDILGRKDVKGVL